MAPFHTNSFTNTGGSMTQNHGQSTLSSSNIGPVTPEALEIAGRCTESMLALDAQFPTLAEKLRIGMNEIEKCDSYLIIMIIPENIFLSLLISILCVLRKCWSSAVT